MLILLLQDCMIRQSLEFSSTEIMKKLTKIMTQLTAAGITEIASDSEGLN
jgi:hypothetical protein